MYTSQQNLRIQKWVAAVSVLLLIIKFIAYYLTFSVAILSDALESIVNVVAGFIGLYSLYIAAQPRDANHPYGHGKAEFLSAAVEGTLIGVAGIAILYKAIAQLIHPVELKKIDTGIYLIAITAAINYGMGTFCVMVGKKNNSIALQASGKHLQTDTWSTVAVVAGLILMYFTNLPWVDAVVAITISVFILYTSYKIIRASVAGIMDEADEELLNGMIEDLNNQRHENWVDLHNLRVIKYGNLLHVDCHLTVPWYLNVHEAHREIDLLSKTIENKCGDSIELFVHTDGCHDFQCSICSKKDCEARKHPFKHQLKWTLENVVSNQKHQAP
ncbi:MAG: cation diffusion facilitator family transporter [Niabella sp.]